jgi:hypothetical protein
MMFVVAAVHVFSGAFAVAGEVIFKDGEYIGFIHYDECGKLTITGDDMNWIGGTCQGGKLSSVSFETNKVDFSSEGDKKILRIGSAATFEIGEVRSGFGGRHEITGVWSIRKNDGSTWTGDVIFKEVRQ